MTEKVHGPPPPQVCMPLGTVDETWASICCRWWLTLARAMTALINRSMSTDQYFAAPRQEEDVRELGLWGWPGPGCD